MHRHNWPNIYCSARPIWIMHILGTYGRTQFCYHSCRGYKHFYWSTRNKITSFCKTWSCLQWLVDKKSQKNPIPPGHAFPVLHALQGHPESPRLWEKHIHIILTGPSLRLHSSTHEPCLYTWTYKDNTSILRFQVDYLQYLQSIQTSQTDS